MPEKPHNADTAEMLLDALAAIHVAEDRVILALEAVLGSDAAAAAYVQRDAPAETEAEKITVGGWSLQFDKDGDLVASKAAGDGQK